MMTALEETKDILAELVALATISSEPNLEMIDRIAARLAAAGAHLEVLRSPSGHQANLFATLGPRGPGGVVLSGHTDVVPVEGQAWTSDPFVLRESDGRLFGRGTCDMKGFIAAVLAMAGRIDPASLKRPLHFAFTYDEETGCIGARQLMRDLATRSIVPDIAIIGEPTTMRVIEGHKGCYEYSTGFTGLEGHGSQPDKGVNAVEYAVRYATRLLELREELILRAPANSAFDPPWSTINIGRLAGGIACNVIAGRADVDWETRPVQSADGTFVKEALASYCDDVLLPAMQAVTPEAGIETTIVGEVEGLIPMRDNAARALLTELTGANRAELVSFGTEAGLYQALGTAAVVCGPGSIEQAHKPDESIEVSQLDECLGLLERLADRLARY